MADKRKPTGLAAYVESATPPAPAPARRKAAAAPRHTPPAAQPARAKSAPAQGERLNLTYRCSPATWERLKHLAISDRASIQDLIHTALSRELQRRGLPPLAD